MDVNAVISQPVRVWNLGNGAKDRVVRLLVRMCDNLRKQMDYPSKTIDTNRYLRELERAMSS